MPACIDTDQGLYCRCAGRNASLHAKTRVNALLASATPHLETQADGRTLAAEPLEVAGDRVSVSVTASMRKVLAGRL